MERLRSLIIVPATNTTMEPEMTALCPELAPIAVARVRRGPGMLTPDNIPAYIEATLAAAEPFFAQPLDIVVHGCTAAGFLAGPEGNARVVAALRARSGARVVSTADAMVEVLRHSGVTRTAVATPYLPAVNDGLRAYLAASGIAVEVLETLACPTLEALRAVTQAQVRDLALRTVTSDTEALFIACSQLPTLGIIDDLRARLKIPVWSSIQASAWAAVPQRLLAA
jgi:maleate cis-trans isomerase